MSSKTSRGGGWVVAQAVLLAAVFLSALVGLGWPDAVEPFAWLVGALVCAAGAALLVAGAVGLGSALTPYPAPRAQARLRTDGIYAYVRHPMYGGGIMLALGWSLLFATPPGLFLTLVLAVFADRKSRREERWLESTYSEYAGYRARTRCRLIPFVW